MTTKNYIKLANVKSSIRPIKFNTELYNVYFASDFHFGHNKEFIYKDRGFNSIQEHDDAIISRCSSAIIDNGKTNILIYLGDFSLNAEYDYVVARLKQLTDIFDQIIYIYGNHESKITQFVENNSDGKVPFGFKFNNELEYDQVIFCGYMQRILFDNRREIICSHFPLYDTPRFFIGDNNYILNLCGHCHGTRDALNFKEPHHHKTMPVYDCGIENAFWISDDKFAVIEYNQLRNKVKECPPKPFNNETNS